MKRERFLEIKKAIENFPKVLERHKAAAEERKKRMKDFEPAIKAIKEKESQKQRKTAETTDNTDD